MIQKANRFISEHLARLEHRTGLAVASFILASIMMGCAMLYVQPVFTVLFHGISFSELSAHPFDFSTENPLRYRILAPLMGYLFFLRGPHFFILPLLASWIFLALVYFVYRKRNFEIIDAFLLTAFVAFSCLTLIPLVAPGYTDPVTWLFIFLAFSFSGNILMSALFFMLAMLNHESSFVMLPALILCNYEKNRKSILILLVAFLLACVPHICYRMYVDAHTTTKYSLSFYLSESNVFFTLKRLVLFGPAAVFYAFKLWWILPFCFIIWSAWYKNFFQGTVVLLTLAGALSLVLIAYDYTRMLVIAFPAVMLSYEWMLKHINRDLLRKATLILIAVNFLVLQYHFNYDGAQPMFPWLLNKISARLGMPIL